MYILSFLFVGIALGSCSSSSSDTHGVPVVQQEQVKMVRVVRDNLTHDVLLHPHDEVRVPRQAALGRFLCTCCTITDTPDALLTHMEVLGGFLITQYVYGERSCVYLWQLSGGRLQAHGLLVDMNGAVYADVKDVGVRNSFLWIERRTGMRHFFTVRENNLISIICDDRMGRIENMLLVEQSWWICSETGIFVRHSDGQFYKMTVFDKLAPVRDMRRCGTCVITLHANNEVREWKVTADEPQCVGTWNGDARSSYSLCILNDAAYAISCDGMVFSMLWKPGVKGFCQLVDTHGMPYQDIVKIRDGGNFFVTQHNDHINSEVRAWLWGQNSLIQVLVFSTRDNLERDCEVEDICIVGDCIIIETGWHEERRHRVYKRVQNTFVPTGFLTYTDTTQLNIHADISASVKLFGSCIALHVGNTVYLSQLVYSLTREQQHFLVSAMHGFFSSDQGGHEVRIDGTAGMTAEQLNVLYGSLPRTIQELLHKSPYRLPATFKSVGT